jgi:AraC-like DNA-binding protein
MENRPDLLQYHGHGKLPLFSVRFIRSNQTWQVVETASGDVHCLERLAYQKHYRVSGVCGELGCSQRMLHVVFVRDIGLPPKMWMNLERMVVARRKLAGGECVTQVARDLGFLSAGSFRRKFVAVYQVSPARFVSERMVFDPRRPLPPDWRKRMAMEAGGQRGA